MRLRRLAVSAALVLAAAPVPAHASGLSYLGGCGMVVVQDTTPGSSFGGPTEFVGIVYATVVARTALLSPPVSVDCVLRVNGADTYVLLTHADTSAVVHVVATTFPAYDRSDVGELCDVVTVSGVTEAPHCTVVTDTPVVPQPVWDAADLLAPTVHAALDPLLCPVLARQAHGFYPVYIADDGDVYLFDDSTPAQRIYDCPPGEDAELDAGPATARFLVASPSFV